MSRVLCFGEILLRLGAPGRQLLLQTPTLDVHVGGAEANVALALAQLGHDVRMAGVLPDTALGAAARGELRRFGVDVSALRHGAGRMGLYFLVQGALQRPGEVLYDRADSAFARGAAEGFDWPVLLQGVDWLHLSGVTPALGPEGARAALTAARAARRAGVAVSFDGNFRARLWQAWSADPGPILREIIAEADLLFADHRDMQVVLGHAPGAGDADRVFTAAADAAFAAFPHLKRMAATERLQRSVDHHVLSARLLRRDGELLRGGEHELAPIVDRIGGGDAFAAGVLHGICLGREDAESLRIGLAAACLKHSMPGDFLRVTPADMDAILGESRLDVRR